MATFNFNGVGATAFSVTGTQALSYTEGGVNFTWTITGGDGTNAHGIGGGVGGGGGAFTGFNSTGADGPGIDVFVLDVIDAGMTRFDDAIQFTVSNMAGTWTVNGQPLSLGVNNLTGPQADLTFTYTGSGDFHFFTVSSLTATINCFTAGTRIATPDGPRDVETLKPGDLVLTASGQAQPVKWLGQTAIDTRLMHPAKVNPICITAGALGGGLPERDLLLSSDHAIEIGGTLYNAGALVNGETIYQKRQMPREGFTYYHVETPEHELLLAEGVAAESYIDYVSRDSFDNADEAEPRMIAEMAIPRVSSARLVPEKLRAALAARRRDPLAA